MRPSELVKFLTFSFRENMPVLILGIPGVGKTDIVTSVAKALGMELHISHPVVKEAIDYKGLPAVVDGRAEFLPYGDLRILFEATRPTIFFIDDLAQCELAVQKPIMQLIHGRSIDGQTISKNIIFVGASNNVKDKSGVTPLIEPLKSRFKSIVTLDFHVDDWINWAIKNGMPHQLLSFARFRPELICSFEPTKEIKNSSIPRTVASIGEWMNKKLNPSLYLETFTGAAGEGFAIEFLNFINIAERMPTPQELFNNPKNFAHIKEPSELYALTGSLAHAVDYATLDSLMVYLDTIDVEFKFKTMIDVITRKPDLIKHKTFSEFAIKHADVLFPA